MNRKKRKLLEIRSKNSIIKSMRKIPKEFTINTLQGTITKEEFIAKGLRML